MTNTFKTSQQSGRSMVEMLGVLAIVGVLSIGGVAGYSKAMAKYKINKTLDQVSMLITSVRTAYGNQNSYRGLTTQYAIMAEMVGNDMTLGSASTIKNPYEGSVEISALTNKGAACSGTSDGTYCPMFGVIFNGVDKLACATIASSDWGGSASSGLYAIRISTSDQTFSAVTAGTANTHTWDKNTQNTKLPIDYAEALTECTGGKSARETTNLKASIEWVYF